MLDARRTEEPIVTDGSAWRTPAGHGAMPGAYPGRPPMTPPGQPVYHQPAPLRGPQPAATSWWSDALSDPWRDPEAPVVVVRKPPADTPDRKSVV